MWEQYKKTFLVTQATIWIVALGVTFWSHAWNAGAMFFVVMQMSAIIGAMWATRLKHKIERSIAAPPVPRA
jgi:hypothetical protein